MRMSSLCHGFLAVVFLFASAGALSAQVDVPDPAFQDTNGDGIDGDIARAIFVDGVGGFDGNPGTMAAPKQSLAAGILAAQSALPIRDVYVSEGNYTGAVSLASGVSLYGQFSRANGWQRSAAYITRIVPPSTGILAQNLTAETRLEAFEIQPANAVGFGTTTYGVRVVGGPAGAVIRDNHIDVGSGQPGILRSNESSGASGSTGGGGGSGSCDGSGWGAGGAGATNACGIGGPGGRGGFEGSISDVAGNSSTPHGASGGYGGSGGDPGPDGGYGANGQNGATGPAGGVGPALGTASGGYVPTSGLSGSGTHGRGGSGAATARRNTAAPAPLDAHHGEPRNRQRGRALDRVRPGSRGPRGEPAAAKSGRADRRQRGCGCGASLCVASPRA